MCLVGTYVSGKSVNAIVETLSDTLVKLVITSKFSFRKKLKLASMPKLQVLGKDLFRNEWNTLPNLIFEKPYGLGSIGAHMHPGSGWCDTYNFFLKNFTSRSIY